MNITHNLLFILILIPILNLFNLNFVQYKKFIYF